jgi:hypothetical protein
MGTVKAMFVRFRRSEEPLEVGLETIPMLHVTKNLNVSRPLPETMRC